MSHPTADDERSKMPINGVRFYPSILVYLHRRIAIFIAWHLRFGLEYTVELQQLILIFLSSY